MGAVKKRQRRRPITGAQFIGLAVGTDRLVTGPLLDEITRATGITWVHRWTALGVPLPKREIPPNLDAVLILTDPSVKRTDRADFSAKCKRAQVYCLQAWPNAKDIIRHLEHDGFTRHSFDFEPQRPAAAAPAPVAAPVPIPPPAAAREGEGMAQATAGRVKSDDGKQRLKEAGATLRRLRLAARLSTKDVAQLLRLKKNKASDPGCMTHFYISAIESGSMPPAARVCEALEILFGLKAETIPREATRDNHRLIMPTEALPAFRKAAAPDEPPAAAPSPLPAAPAPAQAAPQPPANWTGDKPPPGVLRTVTPGQALPAPRQPSPHVAEPSALAAVRPGGLEAILLDAFPLRSRLSELGINVRIEITPQALTFAIVWPDAQAPVPEPAP